MARSVGRTRNRTNRAASRLFKIGGMVLRQYVVYVSFLVILLSFSILLWDRGFLSIYNMMNILRQTAMVSIMAVGMTFVLGAGDIDLSIASIVGLSAVIVADILRSGGGVIFALFAACMTGMLIGFANGVITTRARIPSFMVTLGTSGIVTGIASSISDMAAIPISNSGFNFVFGSGNLGSISTLFVWTALVAVAGHLLLKHTPFGRAVLALGGNRAAARFSGIQTARVRVIVLVLSGLAGAFAGVLYAGRLNGARFNLGESDLMTVIAAVTIGGTSFSGGRGSVVGAIVGSVVMGMINNGLLLMGLSLPNQMITRGIIILLAVSMSLRESKEL